MSVEKKPIENNERLHSSELHTSESQQNPPPSSQDPASQPRRKNLIDLASESAHNTLDLNRRLKGFEQSIKSLESQLSTSQKSFHQSLLDVGQKTTNIKEEHSKSFQQIQVIESNYRNLQVQSEQLTTKVSQLLESLQKLTDEQQQSSQYIEHKQIKSENKLTTKIQDINDETEQLKSFYLNLEKKILMLLNNSNTLTQSIQQNNTEQNDKLHNLKSSVDNKFISLENTIRQVEKSQHKDLEHITRIFEDKESNVKEDYQQKINHVEDKHDQEIDKLISEQQRLESESKSLINQTQTQFTQYLEDYQDKHQQLIDDLGEQIEFSNNTISNKFDEQNEINNKFDDEIKTHSNNLNKHNEEIIKQNDDLTQLKTELQDFEHLFNQNVNDTQIHLQDITNTQRSAIQEINNLSLSSKQQQSQQENLASITEGLLVQTEQDGEDINKLNTKTSIHDAQLINITSKVSTIDDEQIQLQTSLVHSQQKTNKNFIYQSAGILLILVLMFTGGLYLSDEINEHQSIANQQMNLISKQNKQQSDLDIKFQNHDSELLDSRLRHGKLIETVQQLEAEVQKVQQLESQVKSYQNENIKLKQQVSKLTESQLLLNESQRLIDDNVFYLNKTKGALAEYEHGKIHSTQWITQQIPSNLTVIIEHFDNKVDLFKFIENEGYFLQDKLAYVSNNVEGTKNYLLLYGNFSNNADAEQAIYELPYSLGNRDKEIRKFGEFQNNNTLSQLN